MPTKSDRPLNHLVIEEMASQIYEEKTSELSSLAESCAGGSMPFDLFAEWTIMQLAELRKSGFEAKEVSVARLIALTGSIQTYLENEHGVSFKPR